MPDKTEKDFLDAYDAYASSVFKHIYFRTNSRETAEDLTQETFLKTWDYMARGGMKINNLKTFIYRVAHNLIVDHYRKKPRIPISLELVGENELSSGPSQEKRADALIERRILEKCMEGLDKKSRQMIIYRYIDDLEIGEISEITGKSANNVSVAIHRALKALKEKMNEKI